MADFKAQYAGQSPTKPADPEGYKAFQQDVLDYMITYEVVTQKAEELAITVTDEEVQTEIDTILERDLRGRPGAVRRGPQGAEHDR